MQFTPGSSLARRLPGPLARRFGPALGRVDAILAGKDDRTVSGRTAMFAFSIRIASAIIAYVSQILLARWIGDFEYGVFVAVWVGAIILGGFACFGFQTGVIRFISEYQAKGHQDELRGVILAGLVLSFLTGSLFAAGGAAAVVMLSDRLHDYYIAPLLLAAILLPMLALEEMQDGVARAFDWPATALGPTFILRPLLILGFMALYIANGHEHSAPTAMLAAIMATWTAALIQLMSLYRRLSGKLPAGPRKYEMPLWLSVSLPIFLVTSFYSLLTQVDILFVSYFMPPEKVAIYFAAVKTLALVHFVSFAIKAGTAHRFASYRSMGAQDRYESFIRETVQWTFWPSLALALAMCMFGKYFLLLFGETFVEGQPLIWILAAGLVFRAMVGPAESVLTMSGEQSRCATVYGVSLGVNLVLNWYLIPVYGLSGAAIATSCAMTFEAVALYAVARHRLGLHIFVFSPRRQDNAKGGNGR